MKTELVREVLRSLPVSDVPIQYVMLGGNAGDALINLGFFQLADEMGLEFEVVRWDRVRNGATVVVSGSGGLVPEQGSGGAVSVLDSIHGRVNRLIVLPSSVRGNEDLLGRIGPNVVLFTRELASFRHASAAATAGAKVLIDHDMAFNLDAKEFLEGGRMSLPYLSRWKDLARLVLYGAAQLRSMLHSEIEVRRIDQERLESRKPWRWYNDLSAIAAYRNGDRANDENTGRMLLSLLGRYDCVATDRLHVGIGAFLLDKEVVLSDNSYGKIRGVYDYSLSEAPNVTFAD